MVGFGFGRGGVRGRRGGFAFACSGFFFAVFSDDENGGQGGERDNKRSERGKPLLFVNHVGGQQNDNEGENGRGNGSGDAGSEVSFNVVAVGFELVTLVVQLFHPRFVHGAFFGVRKRLFAFGKGENTVRGIGEALRPLSHLRGGAVCQCSQLQ